jgi:hypothetical protein
VEARRIGPVHPVEAPHVRHCRLIPLTDPSQGRCSGQARPLDDLLQAVVEVGHDLDGPHPFLVAHDGVAARTSAAIA